jgi:hypothetical protein
MLPLIAVSSTFLGLLALLTLPFAHPLAGAVLVAVGIVLIIIGAIAILT